MKPQFYFRFAIVLFCMMAAFCSNAIAQDLKAQPGVEPGMRQVQGRSEVKPPPVPVKQDALLENNEHNSKDPHQNYIIREDGSIWVMSPEGPVKADTVQVGLPAGNTVKPVEATPPPSEFQSSPGTLPDVGLQTQPEESVKVTASPKKN